MKKKIRNIAATVLSLVIALPVAVRADENIALRDIDTHSDAINNSDDNYNAATELIQLDQEAIDELSQLGFDFDDMSNELATSIIDYAQQYLGRPYLHGAKGPKAFDCSGFTSYVFKEYGIELSPSSSTQYTQGYKISTDEVRPGDLLFFSGRSGKRSVGHVALAVDVDEDGTITFIHASTSNGISYDTYPDGGYYSRRYIGARRVID